MLAAKVLICEASGDWAALVRRNMPSGATIVEMRQLDELWTHLREAPRAVAAMELHSERGPELMASLRRINREFPQAVSIVLTDRSLGDWEELCREAGAAAVIVGPRSIVDLVEIIRFRHRSEAGWTVDDEQSPLEDRILANLPWGT